MSLTKFNESVTNHQSLPDKPTLSSAELKTLWDKAGVDIKNYLNQILTEEIDSKISEYQTKIDNNTSLINNNTSSINNMLNTVYPVGSIYMSINNTNPSTIKFKIDLSTKIQKSFTIDNVISVYVGYDGNSYLAAQISTTFEIEIMN